ncbi:MAG: hypothetical protein IH840_12935 [Candidatus Heimdallarchaeota archaeon]|nr:hypothetical protein [Candidatus Heimdallarchaeota archaeon]
MSKNNEPLKQQINESEENAGKDRMNVAYKLASQLVKDRLETEDKENMDILNELQSDDIIVIEGTYDHIHLVLKNSGLPFKRIQPSELQGIKLRPDQTIFINCAGTFPPEMTRKITVFVADGGQLITTDWCLKSVIEVSFPGKVKYNGKSTSDEVVRIEVLEKEDSILKGFLDEEADPQWWLEGSSYPIRIIDKKAVKVLVRSKQLSEKYEAEPVIISFEHGKGSVYHMISHFYLQRSETRDAEHEMKASEYASMKGVSIATQKMFEDAEGEIADLNYGVVQSAGTSTEFVSRALLKQKKKFRKK